MNTNVAQQPDRLMTAWMKLRAALDSWKQYSGGRKSTPQPLATGFKIAGNHWWGVYSGTYFDRDAEAFTKEAIDAFIERVDSGVSPYPELRVWHVGKGKKGLRIGQTDLIARVGNFVMAAGTFDDTRHAQKAKAYYQAHLDETAFSHGYEFTTADRKDGVYSAFDTFEISTLDRGYESFPYTKLRGIKAMDMPILKRKRLEAIFGKEDLDALLADIESEDKELERRGVLHKALEAAPEAELPAQDDEGIAELVAVCERMKMTPGELAALLSAALDSAETPEEAPDEGEAEPAPDDEELLAAAQTKAGYVHNDFWNTVVKPQTTKEVKTARDPFWRHEVKQKAATRRLTIGKKSIWGNGSTQFDIGETADAIAALQAKLELPQALIDVLVRRYTQEDVYDLLKSAIEAGGGRVELSAEVVS